MTTKVREATGRELAVRARRIVGPDDEIETHRTVHCARRGAVPLAECLTCAHCDGLRVRADGGMAVACRHDDAEPQRASGVASFARPSDATRTQVTAIMTADVVCVRTDVSLSALRDLLASEKFSGTPVVDDRGRAVGVVSRTDLVQAARAPGCATVDDIMMPMAFTLRETSTVAQAAALMAFEGIHRVPVVGAAGEVVGIVSAMDVMRWLAQHDGYLVRRDAP